jgi:ElaB/YqjD/DUF883 family membrane-anchored ribosome-binding protein
MTYERYQTGGRAGDGSSSSREIQSDVLEIRSEMSKTLDEIAHKLEPRELLTQLTNVFTQGGATRFLKNFAGAIERNPIPAVLIGGGIGYMIYEGMQQRSHAAPMGTGSGMATGSDSFETGGVRSSARELASNATARAGEMAQRARQGARQAQEGAQRVKERAADAAKHAAQASRDLAHKGQELVREQPLVLAGLGVALGAALAASSPVSRREAQLIGEPAGHLMEELQERALQIKDRVEAGVRAAGDAAKEAITEPNASANATNDPNTPNAS